MNMKIIKGCGWGVLSLVLLFAIIAVLASPIAKHIVNTKGEAIIGRQLHAEKVRVNVLNGKVTIREFQCFEPNGTTNFFYFDQLYVQIAYPRLLNKKVKIKHLHLDGFSAQILQNKDKLNFSDILERFTSDTVPADSTKKAWQVSLSDIELTNSSIFYHDVQHKKEWQLEHVNLSIPGLTFENEDTNAGLDFALPTGGKVIVEAKYLAPSNSLSFVLNLDDVHSDVLLPLVQDYYNVSGLGAKMNGQLRLLTQLDNIQNIDVRGKVVMNDACIKDMKKKEVAMIEEVRVALNHLDLNGRSAILDTLVISGLSGKYEVHKDETTLSRLVVKEQDVDSKKAKNKKQKKKVTTNKPKSKPFVWVARNATLTAKDLTYEDDSQKNDWQYTVSTLRVDGKNVSSNGRNNLRINATMSSNAKLKADYTGGWDVKRQNAQLNVTLSNVRMRDFDALCRNYTGYPIEGGTLFAETHMDFNAGQLTGNTRLVIDNPTIGKREKLTKAKYRDLPVRNTFKSLVDSDNRVVVNAPVSADATKKDFSFSSVFVKSLVKELFGHMMRTKSKKDKISEEEQEAIEAFLGDDEPKVEKQKAKEDKQQAKEAEKKAKEEAREAKKAERDKRRNDRKKAR